MSSRNAYLSDAQRAEARSLHRALLTMRDALRTPAFESARRRRRARNAQRAAAPDYFDVVDAETFEPVERLRRRRISSPRRASATRLHRQPVSFRIASRRRIMNGARVLLGVSGRHCRV